MSEAPNIVALPRAGDVVGTKYIVDVAIGAGAMGVVYRARHAITGKVVALKMLQPHVGQSEGVVRRFLEEARASARIGHGNIVDTYDAGEWNGLPFLVMELLSGESLDVLLRRRGRLDIPETMRVLGPVFAAVHAAHRAGVIHRDLKPENIFLCGTVDGTHVTPKVLDFGVSKVVETDRPITAPGHSVGTALYMPLEQMFGARDVTAASDVYALGVIVYECLSGTFPYEADSIPELAKRMSSSAPVPLDVRRPELEPTFCTAVMRALDKDLSRRYADVAKLAAAFAPYGLVIGEALDAMSPPRGSWAGTESMETPPLEPDLSRTPLSISEIRRAPSTPRAELAGESTIRLRDSRKILFAACLCGLVVGGAFAAVRSTRRDDARAARVTESARPTSSASPGGASPGASLRVDGGTVVPSAETAREDSR